MRIERLKIQNFRVFRDVQIDDIPPLAVFVGANGTGKSTLFDVFGFLRDALQDNVHVAVTRRGGFKEVRSRDASGPMTFEVKFREDQGPLVTYLLEIGEQDGRAVVAKETLKYRRGQNGRPWHFLDFNHGEGTAVTNEVDYGTPNAEMQREPQKLDSPEILAIKGLGQFEPEDSRDVGVSPGRAIHEALVPEFRKTEGARRLGPLVDVHNRRSKSFGHFVSGVRRLGETGAKSPTGSTG